MTRIILSLDLRQQGPYRRRMIAIFVLVLGAILLWMAVTGRLNTFWEAVKNPQGKPTAPSTVTA